MRSRGVFARFSQIKHLFYCEPVFIYQSGTKEKKSTIVFYYSEINWRSEKLTIIYTILSIGSNEAWRA